MNNSMVENYNKKFEEKNLIKYLTYSIIIHNENLKLKLEKVCINFSTKKTGNNINNI